MSTSEIWRGLTRLLLIAAILGVINMIFFASAMNGFTDTKADEVAINTYALNLFVGWVFFSAWLLMKADDEWKKVAEAIVKEDKKSFLIESRKRIPQSIWCLYLVISVLVVLSFHLFHIESTLVLAEIQFGVGFFLALTIQVLWDLDDPIGGVINVSVPQMWME